MKKFLPVIVIILLFIASSFVSQQYTDIVRDYVLKNQLVGALAYVLAVILAITIAPLSSIPLIPILVSVWGILFTAILTIFSWTIGSIIAFWIARKFGAPIVGKFVSLEKIDKSYTEIPEKNLFWYLLLLRTTIPVDILSYALGILTKVEWKMYIITTFLGIIPAVLLLSYFGSFPVEYQLLLFVLGIALTAFFLFLKKNRKKDQ